MLIDIYKTDGTLLGEQIDLADDVFAIEPNDHVIYLVVKAHLANQRQGTHKSKERGEVRGGGKKPWNQKGRGGARAGTSRSPLWVGGGTIFGPRPRDYRQDLPKKVKLLAKRSALSYKVKDNGLKVVDNFTFDAPGTKKFVEVLKSLEVANKKVLFVTESNDNNLYKSARNIEKVAIQCASIVSTYELLNNEVIVMQKGAVEYLNKKYSNEELVVENA